MKAAVFKGSGNPRALEIEDLPIPVPGAGDLLVKVGRCGICGTDVHMTSGHGWDFPVGTVPGHEYVGEVIEVGKDVERFKVGDSVAGMARAGCGACEACFRGMPLLCRSGVGGMGGFGEYMRLAQGAAVLMPTTFSLADGALVEPMAIGLHGVAAARLRLGADVLVLGAGSVALAVIFWAKRLGARRVVAASRSLARRDMALAMGADAFVTLGQDELEAVREAMDGRGPEVVFECAGVPGMIEQAIAHVAPFGDVVSLGFCTAPDPITPARAAMKQARISFPLAYSPEEFGQAADMLLSGTVDPKIMITSTISLAELPDQLEALRVKNDQTKVQVCIG